MKSILRAFAPSLCAVFLLVAGQSAVSAQQGRDARVISARAGGINFVSGDVRVQRQGQQSWQRLGVQDELTDGDRVRSTTGGRVEVLLNPGSYLRLADEAEVVLADASVENLRLRLVAGSAVVEATGYSDGDEPLMVIETPQTSISIIKSGVYRLNSLASRLTEVAVFEGRAGVGAQTMLVRGSRVARISTSGVDVAKFDRKNKDALDLWSKERAKSIAEASRKLSRRNTSALLASLHDTGWVSPSRRSRYNGAWVFSSLRGCYTFVPFWPGLGSPYGYGYADPFWGDPAGRFGSCNYCDPRNVNTSGTSLTTLSNSGGSASTPTVTTRSPEPMRQPPIPAGSPSRHKVDHMSPVDASPRR